MHSAAPKSPLDLVWQADPATLWESDWIRYVLSDFDVREFRDPGRPDGQTPVVYVGGTEQRPLTALDPDVLAWLRALPRKGLFHISDEYFAGGYSVYRAFDFVIRNHWAPFLEHPAIANVPLGVTNDMFRDAAPPPASARPLAWSFAGNLSPGRIPMLREMARVTPNVTHRYEDWAPGGVTRRLAKPEFKAMLLDSQFLPCAMGQKLTETFRVYEALELGCIPIVLACATRRYYDHLLPGNPIPTVTSWRQAADLVERVRADAAGLDALQARMLDWWTTLRDELPGRIGAVIRARLGDHGPGSLARSYRTMPDALFRCSRLVELTRHQPTDVLVLKARGKIARMIGSRAVRR